jgi:hypothetical protein
MAPFLAIRPRSTTSRRAPYGRAVTCSRVVSRVIRVPSGLWIAT